jgi:uncharacterized delta-60 repeat protein
MSTIRVDKIMPFQSSSVQIFGDLVGSYSGSFDGIFVGDGSGLTGIPGATPINTSSFATTGSNVFHGSQTISGSLTATGFAFAAAVVVNSGSSNTSLGPNSIRLEHSSSEGDHKIIGFSAEPTHTNQPGLANVTEPSLFTADSSSNFYQVMEFQSLGRFPENKVSIKVPVDVSGSLLVTGSARFTSAVTASFFSGSFVGDGSGLTGIAGSINTGSFATTGSNTFRGTETISGSVLVSGSVNADGFELDASSTIVVPTLNSTFNLNLSSSSTPLVTKILPLGDGKILVAGKFESIDGHGTAKIGRLNSDGTVDTSFTAQIGNSDFYQVSSFVTQSDNKIIVVGQFNTIDGNGVKSIGRLNANGSHDATFTDASGYNVGGNLLDVIVQNDNKITVIGGFAGQKILRFNTNGTVDSSLSVPFATGSNVFRTIALQTTNSIDYLLVGGDFRSFDTASDFKLFARLDISGALDTTFAGANLVISSGGIDQINRIKLDSNNDIYIAGRFTGGTGFTQHACIARIFTEDNGDGPGAFDSTFAAYTNGAVYDFDFYDNDKILIGGEFTQAGVYASQQARNKFAVIRRDNGNITSSYSFSDYNLNDTVLTVVNVPSTTNAVLGGYFTQINSTSRDNLASVKLSGFGTISSSADYSITADTNELLISSSNTRFSGDVNIIGNVTASEFSGSFVGDGSGLTNLNLPSGLLSSSVINFTNFSQSVDARIDNIVAGTGFATTGSNTFKGEQIISSSLLVTDIIKGTGSIFLQPDVNDGRKLEIYNTSATDVHIKSNGGLTFLGDDSNYVLIDVSTEKVSITGVNGVVVSGSLNVSGSNTFVGNQTITGSLGVSGSISQKGLGGGGNIVIGDDPITNLNSDAQYNTVIGADAGALLRSGSNNVFIGRMAGLLTQDSTGNVFIGSTAGYNAKAEQNIYIGESAGFSNISGRYNVAIGHNAGYNNKVDLNTFIGYQSGFANTSGSANTFVGERTGNSNTLGSNNSFFGGTAGRDNSVGNNNTFIGQNAGQQNTSGSSNTFVGSQAGSYTTTGNNNTFVGEQAGILNTLGYSNAFFGDNSGYKNTTAYENTFIGSFSGYENKTGIENTFVGTSAGQNNGVGSDNTYIGHRAGNSNISGSNNTLVGNSAGFNITSGSDNTFVGKNAGYYISNGSSAVSGSNRSVFIGTDVKSNGHDETNQIVIGYNAVGNGTNTVTIGNNDITDTYLKGTLRASTAILAQVSSSYNFADDAAAASGGVPLGGLYHTSGTIKIRLA